MADTKISALTAVATPAGTDEFAVNQGGISKKMTLSQIDAFVLTSPVFAAGSASANSWPKLTAGSLLTTAEDGAIEFDGDVFYATSDPGNRGYIPVRHFIRADADRTLTSTTASQAIFNSPTNGRLTLEVGTYLIDGLIHITTMSGTSGNALLSLIGAGGATLGTQLVYVFGADVAAATANATSGSTILGTNTSPASAVSGGTATAVTFVVRGTFEVTVAGTIVPSLSLVTAASAVLKAGSYLMYERIGSGSVVSVGQWD
jgi:hypothetical protein